MSTAAQPAGRHCRTPGHPPEGPLPLPSRPPLQGRARPPRLSLSPGSSSLSLSLSGTRSPCLSPDGSAGWALQAWAEGRSCRRPLGGQGAPAPDSSSSSKALAPSEPVPWHVASGCLRTPLPQPPVPWRDPPLLPGQLTTKQPSLSGAYVACCPTLIPCQLAS